jgi:hypothetical protein
MRYRSLVHLIPLFGSHHLTTQLIQQQFRGNGIENATLANQDELAAGSCCLRCAGKCSPSARPLLVELHAQVPDLPVWSCHDYVPVSQLIYAAFRSNAKGLLPPSDEWRRRGL